MSSKQSIPVPWWGKIILGMAGIFAVVKWTPIVEILNLFFYICIIPIGLLASVGILSDGAMQGIQGGWQRTRAELNTRVSERVEAARKVA